MVRTVEREVRRRGFASKSEFIRHLIRLWNTRELATELHDRRDDFASGEGKTLSSLKGFWVFINRKTLAVRLRPCYDFIVL